MKKNYLKPLSLGFISTMLFGCSFSFSSSESQSLNSSFSSLESSSIKESSSSIESVSSSSSESSSFSSSESSLEVSSSSSTSKTSSSSSSVSSSSSSSSVVSSSKSSIVKTEAVINFSLSNNGLHVLDTDPLPTATVSKNAKYTVTFQSDSLKVEGLPAPTETGITWSIVVEVEENEYYFAKKEWRWFYYDHDENASSNPDGSTILGIGKFDIPTKKWGVDGNNGIAASNVKSNSSGIIDITIEAANRRGGALESKDFYGPGSFSMDAIIPKTTGICYAIWTFYYADEGDVNHEIDIEVYDNNKVVYSSYISEKSGTHEYSDIDDLINDGEYHNYRFDWHNGTEGSYVEYFIDGVKKCKITKTIPTHEMKLWVGAWCPTWAGETMTGSYHMFIKNIKYKAY